MGRGIEQVPTATRRGGERRGTGEVEGTDWYFSAVLWQGAVLSLWP